MTESIRILRTVAPQNTDGSDSTAPAPEDAGIAPWPVIDKYPIIIGSGTTLQYISSAFRDAQSGYRQTYVDLLDELLEREPHGFAVLSQRILATAGGRLEITAAEVAKPKLKPGQKTPDAAADAASQKLQTRAEEIADFVRGAFDQIPSLSEAFAGLLWSLYYGVAACEISWGFNADGQWIPERLHFVHSRRLSYPDPGTWDLHIWDQGAVRFQTGFSGAAPRTVMAPTSGVNRTYGVTVSDYPGKFITHTPQLRGDYPTRDGLGRELAYWFALKGIAARSAAQYAERFSKPFVVGTFNTSMGDKNVELPRVASQEDINKLNAVVQAIGLGNTSGATIPDSTKLDIHEVTGGIDQGAFIQLVNAEISKAVVGQTLTTEMGSAGSRAAAQVHKDGAKEFARYDAGCLAATLKRDLSDWIVRLNFPDEMALAPRVTIQTDDKPDPLQAVAVAKAAVSIGMPLDGRALAERLGLQLVDPDDPNAIALAMPAVGAGNQAVPKSDGSLADEDQDEHPGNTADSTDPDDDEDAAEHTVTQRLMRDMPDDDDETRPLKPRHKEAVALEKRNHRRLAAGITAALLLLATSPAKATPAAFVKRQLVGTIAPLRIAASVLGQKHVAATQPAQMVRVPDADLPHGGDPYRTAGVRYEAEVFGSAQGDRYMSKALGGLASDATKAFKEAKRLDPDAKPETHAKAATRAVADRTETISRTETYRAYNDGSVEAARRAGLTLRWDATLDRRTCPECESLDGSTNWDAPPPEHPDCRCVLTPVTH